MDDKQFFSEQIVLESKNLAMCRAEMHRLYNVEDREAGTSVWGWLPAISLVL